MHVRRGQSDVTQGWNRELPAVARSPGDQKSAQITRFNIEAVVGKGLALKERSTMAVKAIGAELLTAWIILGVEEFKAALLFIVEFRFSAEGTVEFRSMGGLGEEELFQGEREAVGVDLRRAEGAREQILIRGEGLQFRDDMGQGIMHFPGILDREQHLVAQTGRPSIPKEGFLPCQVEKRHGIAGA